MQRIGDIDASDPDQLSEMVTRSLGLTAVIKTDGSRPFISRMSTCVGSLFAMIENRNEADVYAHFPGGAEALSFVLLDRGHVGPEMVRREDVVGRETITMVDHEWLNAMHYYGQSDILTATLEKKAFRSFAFKVLGRDLPAIFEKPFTLERESDVGDLFATALRLTGGFIGLAADGKIPEFAARRMEEATLSSIILHLERVAGVGSRVGDPLVPRQVRLAISLIEASTEPLHVSDVAEKVGVSIRALQLGFRDILGITPLDYIKQHRLAMVRSGVMERGTAALKPLCRKWGFVNYSRFRRDYIERYGEEDWTTVMRPR